jgi:hypothetical protein
MMLPRRAAPAFDGAVSTDSHGRMDLRTSCYPPKIDESSTPAPLGRAFAMLIEFLQDAKLHTPGTGGRSWPVAPVSQDSFARRMRTVMQDGIPSVHFGARHLALRANPAVGRARGMAAESACRAEGTDVDEKNCETNPITAQESW